MQKGVRFEYGFIQIELSALYRYHLKPKYLNKNNLKNAIMFSWNDYKRDIFLSKGIICNFKYSNIIIQIIIILILTNIQIKKHIIRKYVNNSLFTNIQIINVIIRKYTNKTKKFTLFQKDFHFQIKVVF